MRRGESLPCYPVEFTPARCRSLAPRPGSTGSCRDDRRHAAPHRLSGRPEHERCDDLRLPCMNLRHQQKLTGRGHGGRARYERGDIGDMAHPGHGGGSRNATEFTILETTIPPRSYRMCSVSHQYSCLAKARDRAHASALSTPAPRRLPCRHAPPSRVWEARSAQRGVLMRSAVITGLLVALAISGSAQAVARDRRPYRAPHREGIATPPFAYPRPPGTRLRPADDGIIHWNTPNKDGNLGGPSTGGSGGGGG